MVTPKLGVRKDVRKKTSLTTVPKEHNLGLQASVYTSARLQNSQQRNENKMENAEPSELKYSKYASAVGYLTFPFISHIFTF